MFIPCIPRPQKVCFNEGCVADLSAIYTFSPDLPNEHYKIVVEDNIEIFYADEAALQYAKNTLKSFVDYYKNGLPKMIIEDGPKHSFRGLMLDVGRYFYPIESIKKILDYMAQLKLNVFHIHLTEDQGWRFQSEKYHFLTEVGSKRKHTNWNRKPHGGYYTKEELKDIVKYAHDRSIIVIPEIDVPGHTRSAIAAYPELACMPRKIEVASHVGVKHDILCAGKEFTYTFVKDIIEECLEIFTDGYFHLGGDEAVKTRWKLCPNCQAKIRELGLKDEDELQTYFTNRIVREVLLPMGVKPITWKCGDNPEGLDENIIVQYYEGAQTKVETSHKLINSNSLYLYLDIPYSISTLDGNYTLSKDPNTAIAVGIEACIWTEFIKDIERAEYMMFPRLLAQAENMWGTDGDYQDFLVRAKDFYQRNDSKNYCPIEKASPKNFKFFRNFHWNVIRPLYWEGLGNLIDNAKVAKMFKESTKKD